MDCNGSDLFRNWIVPIHSEHLLKVSIGYWIFVPRLRLLVWWLSEKSPKSQ